MRRRNIINPLQLMTNADDTFLAGLRVLIQASPLAILALDTEGKVRTWSAAAERIFGWSAGEVMGLPAPFAAPAPTGDFRLMLEMGLNGDELATAELLLPRRDGTAIDVSVSIAPLKMPDGAISGVVAILADITERKRTEQTLAKERNLLLALMDNLPDMIFVKDPEGRYITGNLAHLRFLGKSSVNEVIGKTDADLFPGETAASRGRQALEIMRTGQALVDHEELLLDSRGAPRWFSTTDVPFRDPYGEVAGIIGLSRDVTSRKLLESQLAQAQKLESIGHLAAGIAHELNTPIQYVSDNTSFLSESFGSLGRVLSEYQCLFKAAQGGAVTAERLSSVEAAIEETDLEYVLQEIPKAIQQSTEGVERVSTIVKAMKEFSHPGVAVMKTVDLNHSIHSTVEVSRNEWKYIADMRLDLDPQLTTVHCLPGELNQVVLNLILNAAHAIEDVPRAEPGKGNITISTRRDGDWAEIRVRDTGTGIPEAVQPQVFTPFFTTKEVGKGTGQGLSIAHAVVVQKHRGTIHFETEAYPAANHGTVFIVRIPVHGSLNDAA
jgi:PAS domain S-box-containing protein